MILLLHISTLLVNFIGAFIAWVQVLLYDLMMRKKIRVIKMMITKTR